MNKKWSLIAFVAMVVIQWIVPIQMVVQKQVTMLKGEEYRFKIIPVDPIDPLRGRYLALSFDQNTFQLEGARYYDTSNKLYTEIEHDQDGFAKTKRVYFDTIPSEMINYINVNDFYTIQNDTLTTVHYTFPFSRFYVNEKAAPKLEKEYLSALRDTTRVCYAKVHVYKGHSVLKEIVVE